MELYENKNILRQAISLTSEYFHMDPAIIEKDYFVTILLREINNNVDNLVFKGGTSLSKCYKVINRFSEDIDLTLVPENLTESKRRNLVKSVIKACDTLNFEIINKDQIKSRMSHNQFNVAFDHYNTLLGINPNILVETVFTVPSYPYEIKQAASYIYEYFHENNKEDIINQFHLQPFIIKTQSLKRTFVDKTFAICDYYLKNNLDKHSRHIYDLYKLFDKINFDEEFKNFIKQVRESRKLNKGCLSAQDGFNVNECLKEIINKDVYKSDFEKFTKNMLTEEINYETFKVVINWIIDANIF